MSTIVALPPGIYSIDNGTYPPSYLTEPGLPGYPYFVSRGHNGVPANDQMFLIDGSGQITALQSSRHPFVTAVTINRQVVSVGDADLQWIIGVNAPQFPQTKWVGSIMTNDISRMYWGLNANYVQLQADQTNWYFAQIDDDVDQAHGSQAHGSQAQGSQASDITVNLNVTCHIN